MLGLDEENTQVVDAFLASPEGAGFSVAPLSEAQILQLPEFDQAKKLVSVRQNDRGLFQSVPVTPTPTTATSAPAWSTSNDYVAVK